MQYMIFATYIAMLAAPYYWLNKPNKN